MLIYMHEQHSKGMLKFVERIPLPVKERVNVDGIVADDADDNDVMMLKEQIGNSFGVQKQDKWIQGMCVCVRVLAHFPFTRFVYLFPTILWYW